MLAAVDTIPLWRLAIGMAPALAAVCLLWRWSLASSVAVYALARMTLQLALLGYVLVGVFSADSPLVVALVLSLMLCVASSIALRAVKPYSWRHYGQAMAAIVLGGGLTLIVVTQGVLAIAPWYEPRFVIPLAGMTFAQAMNTVSVAAERFASEAAQGTRYAEARNAAMRAGMLPVTNNLLAIGLVAIPGMMTGQVLAGEDPLDAARYQGMVMAMVFGSSGLAAGAYLAMQERGYRGGHTISHLPEESA